MRWKQIMKIETIGYAAIIAGVFLFIESGYPSLAAEKKGAAAPTICIELYQPVCGAKGNGTKTYSNACFAKADGAKVVSQGECPAAKPRK